MKLFFDKKIILVLKIRKNTVFLAQGALSLYMQGYAYGSLLPHALVIGQDCLYTSTGYVSREYFVDRCAHWPSW